MSLETGFQCLWRDVSVTLAVRSCSCYWVLPWMPLYSMLLDVNLSVTVCYWMFMYLLLYVTVRYCVCGGSHILGHTHTVWLSGTHTHVRKRDRACSWLWPIRKLTPEPTWIIRVLLSVLQLSNSITGDACVSGPASRPHALPPSPPRPPGLYWI